MVQPIRPEDVLPEGDNTASVGDVPVRKGTIAAFVSNAKALENLPEGRPEYDAVVAQLRALAPGLRAVGLLDVFTPRSPTIAALLDQTD